MGKEEPHVLDIVGPEELSTSDRMFLTLGAFKKTIFWAKMGLVGLIVIMIWSVGTDNYGVVEFIEEIYWWWTVLPLTVLVVVMLVWLVVSGGKLSGTSDILRRQHRMETYFATLSLATRETDDLSLDFFNIAVDVFPELKQHESEINQESTVFRSRKVSLGCDFRNSKCILRNLKALFQ